jgi:hypothetical protein
VKYFLDTEYTDDGVQFHLISIAIVAEDGREFYAAVRDAELSQVDPWVVENVLPQLPPKRDSAWKPRAQIRDEIAGFVTGGDIEFWSMCAWVDWSLVVRLFGHFNDTPEGWPMACWDLWQLESELGASADGRPPEPDGAHNALVDARYHREIYDYLRELQSRAVGAG